MASNTIVWLLTLIALVLLKTHCNGASILAYLPFSAKSHHIMFNPILKALAERNHQVTVYRSLTMEDKPANNYKEIILPNFLEQIIKSMDFNVVQFGKGGFLGELMGLNEIGHMVTEASFKSKEFKRLLESQEKFDLIITESLFAQYSTAALSHRFGAPLVNLMPLGNVHWTNFIASNPFNPSYIPIYSSASTSKMNYLERLVNTAQSLLTVLVTRFYYIPKFQKLVDDHLVYDGSSSRPPLIEILFNTSLVIENSHYSLNGATPRAPNFIAVAGLNIKPSKPLPPNLKKWLDEGNHGCIYFSYGTVVQGGQLDENIQETFLKVFSKLKQRVLWKMDKKLQLPSNVLTQAWMPQQDILAHPNVKLFITHGGYLSINEAVYNSVPLIGTPFFGDQAKNLNEVIQGGYGIRLDYENLTEESLTWAINDVFNNKRYQEKIKEVSSIYKDRENSALDTAIYWIEHVIKYKGAPHLRPQSAFMPWYQAELLDVALIALGLVLLSILMLRKFFLFITCQTCRPPKDIKKKTS